MARFRIITSPSTENQWKTINRGHKKPPTVSHISYYQILVIINRYEALRNGREVEQMEHEPEKTDELEMRDEDREKIQKKSHKQKETKHRVTVIGDSHARGCAAEIKSNLDENFDVQGFVNPGTGLSTIIFIHSFIYFAFCKSIQGHKQPKGYRTCHTANAKDI